jgi:RNA-directed DNA polymerase
LKKSIENIGQEIQDRLIRCASDKLHLNPKKSKHFQIGGKVKILGVMILPNGKITIDSKLKSEMEVLLYFYINNKEKFLDCADHDEQKAIGRITGFLNYANSIDQEYLNKLRKKFGATIIDTLLHRPLT